MSQLQSLEQGYGNPNPVLSIPIQYSLARLHRRLGQWVQQLPDAAPSGHSATGGEQPSMACGAAAPDWVEAGLQEPYLQYLGTAPTTPLPTVTLKPAWSPGLS